MYMPRWRTIPGTLLSLLAMACEPRVRTTQPPAGGAAQPATGLLAFRMKTNDGKERELSTYRGKVLLIVNVASQCGNTPQYEGLEAMYRKYHDRGFEILAFPANEFGAQEPGSDAEIRKFCTEHYNVTFDLFSKIVVKGEGISPLYAYLTSRPGISGDIAWNFAKFLVNRNGEVVARFSPKTQPDDPVLVAQLEAALRTNP
jgi:glutathione peroxidase